MPFPERFDEQPLTETDDPPDYLKSMATVNLDDHAGRTEDMMSPDRSEYRESWESDNGELRTAALD